MTGGEVFLFICCLIAIYRVLAERTAKNKVLRAYRKLSDSHKELLDMAMSVDAHNLFLQMEIEQLRRRNK